VRQRVSQHPALSKGGVAVITGGASGIGLAAARRFAAFGMKLVLADLSQDAPRSYPTPSWSPYRPMSARSMR
jgi:NAD(P)-dependent dehydrogenase (short-subunit alcohol dehydrogenase family)